MRRIWIPLALFALTVGCEEDPALDAGPGADAGAELDAGPGAMDAGFDAGVDGGPSDAGPPPLAALAITPASQDFGLVAVGESSSPEIFTVTNVGGWRSDVIAVRLEGTSQAEYVIVDDGCLNARLGPGARCMVTVAYRPTASGMDEAVLIADAGPGMQAMATLRGEACLVGDPGIVPTSHDFGSVAVGGSSADVTFRLWNSACFDLPPFSITLGGADAADFSLPPGGTCGGGPLPSGATCTFPVRFTPSTPAGPKTATLTVTDGTFALESRLRGTGS